MKDLAVADVQEVVPSRTIYKPTQAQCEALRGDTPCARCSCDLRTHVWAWGTVGACRLHGGFADEWCEAFVIDQDFAKLRDSQPND